MPMIDVYSAVSTATQQSRGRSTCGIDREQTMDMDLEARAAGGAARSRTWTAPWRPAGLLTDSATRHTERIGQVAAEADRMRTMLLAAVGHDLRSPLAAARAAVSCLRSPGLQLTEADQNELLATAEESLELLSHLVTSLLDITRLQAGGPSVLPRPADLAEVVGCALAGLGPQGQAVQVDLSPDLPEVAADPPVLERVIANVTANALRYAPTGIPPLLTAERRGGWVDLRVADRGPGVRAADRELMFAPFQRLGETDPATGVGLGLAVSRGLTEAMGGTLRPEETPGGGLTMTISLPAALPADRD